MTTCAVCKQDVTDIAAHVFVCTGVQAAVKKSQEPKSMEVVNVVPVSIGSTQRTQAIGAGTVRQGTDSNAISHVQDVNQMRHEHRSQPRTDAGTIQAPQNGNRKSIEGAELEHALALIKVLHQYVLEHRNDPTQIVGDNGHQFIYKMNYAMLKYGLKTFVSPAQYNWLRGLEKSIHKAITDLAPSR